jgi:hypothetical protein
MRAVGARLALVLLLSAGPAVSAASAPEPACPGLTPPRRVSIPPVTLPASFTAARVGGEVVDEVVIGKDGAVVSLRLVRARWEGLAPFGEVSVKKAQFIPGSIEGNPVAVRGLVATVLGTVALARVEPEYDLLWAHVPAGASREARWQLAESVEGLDMTVHVGTPSPEGAVVVAKAPSGSEKTLWKLPPSQTPVDRKQTVETGRFFRKSGDYRLELRAGNTILASTTVTIAPDFSQAIVNACERIP